LFLRIAKTNTDVFCPLPQTVLDALKAIDAKGDYYFWTGTSKPKSAVGDYQRALRKLFDAAGVPRVHAHLFRHSFATDLLTDKNSIGDVAALLAHSSAKVTEKSYKHWIVAQQENLEAGVKNTWSHLGPVYDSAAS
jgi:integrase